MPVAVARLTILLFRSKNKMQGKDKITHKATMAVDKKSLQIVTTAFRFLGAMSVVTGL